MKTAQWVARRLTVLLILISGAGSADGFCSSAGNPVPARSFFQIAEEKIATVLSPCSIYAQSLDYFRRRWKLRFLGYTSDWKLMPQGFWIKLDLNDWPDRMFFFGINEPDHIRFLDVLLRPGDMCFDVGANKGFYALQMARAVGSSGAVFAFEPDSRVWPMLQENAKRNNFTNLKVLPLAVSDKSGSAVFSLSSQIGWSGFVPSASPHHKVVRTETVRVVSLDGFFEDMKLRSHKDCILFIKIDAEGSEKMIIDGMERVLTDYDPVFHIEINDKGPNGLALLAHLRAKGYHVYTLDLDANKKELKLRPVEGIPQADIVAFRDSPMVGQRLKDIL